MNPSKEPKKIVWIDDYDGGKYPACPNCKEPAYYTDECCFCGQKFVQDDEALQINHSVQIERDGYTVVQASNNHIHIYDKNGMLISHMHCSRKMTEKELEGQLEFIKKAMGKGVKTYG
jgi:hypothetical protein